MQSAAERDAQRCELAELRERLSAEARAALRMAQMAGMSPENRHAAEAAKSIDRACARPSVTLQPGERWE